MLQWEKRLEKLKKSAPKAKKKQPAKKPSPIKKDRGGYVA
jgi:hypothetical protein